MLRLANDHEISPDLNTADALPTQPAILNHWRALA
jgi:hypothetical protein